MRLFNNSNRLPRVVFPDEQVWVNTLEDEIDAIEIGWRVVNCLLPENHEVVDLSILETISYIEYEERKK